MPADKPRYDPLDTLLTPRENSGSREVREQVFAQTARVQRRRRVLRRSLYAAALAAVYVAGAGTLYVYNLATSSDVAPAQIASGAPSQTDVEPPAKATPPATNIVGAQHATQPAPPPAEENGDASSKPRSRFESLRDLGDRYLLQRKDPAAAARCYRLALRYATAEERRAQSSGTWLYRALRNSLLQETAHATPHPPHDHS